MKIVSHIRLLLLFLFFFYAANAQISDSLYNVLPDSVKPANKNSLKPGEKQKILIRAGYDVPKNFYTELDRFVDAVSRETETAPMQEKINYTYAIANYYYCRPDREKTINYYTKLVKYITMQGGHQQKLAEAYRNMGDVFSYAGRQDSSVRYIQNALDIYRSIKDQAGIATCFRAFGGMYYDLQLYEKSIYYNNLFLANLSPKQIWGEEYTFGWLFNTACYLSLFEKTGRDVYIDSASYTIATVMQKKKADSLLWYGACYFFRGRVFFCKQEYRKALVCFDSSLLSSFCDKDQYFRGIKTKLFYRALSLIKTGNYQAGKTILDSITTREFSTQKKRNYTLYEYAESRGDWKSALSYYKEFKRYSDSVDLVGLNGTDAEYICVFPWHFPG